MRKNDVSQYLSLLRRFLAGEISTGEFQTTYLDMLKHEERQFEPTLFSVLDTLFGDLDSFAPDPALRAELELQNLGFYLDEVTLRSRVSDAYERLATFVREFVHESRSKATQAPPQHLRD